MSNTTTAKDKKPKLFTGYEAFMVAILAFIQFTVILDFMVLSPLGFILMPELGISASQFSGVVSAYAISAGLSGLLAAGFADKFDRKKLLLFFYTGFVLGTLLCGIAPNYEFLFMARIVTGIFGGVIGSISFAIITDIFRMEVRGRVMGFVQMAFAGSQVMGIPAGLYLANRLGWHSPFLMIVGVSALVGVAIMMYMKPVDAHLQYKSDRHPVMHLLKTISRKDYVKGFAATALLATGGFMLMPFGSAFSVNNMGVHADQLTMVYMITGISSMIAGPLVGKLSDRTGKYKTFVFGSLLSMTIVAYYCNLEITPLWIVIGLNILLFVGISSRMIAASALMTSVPEPQDRGAYMSINSSLQQISGGIAAILAGKIVVITASGRVEHYNTLGYVVVGTISITIFLMYIVNKHVMNKPKPDFKPQQEVKEEVLAAVESR